MYRVSLLETIHFSIDRHSPIRCANQIIITIYVCRPREDSQIGRDGQGAFVAGQIKTDVEIIAVIHQEEHTLRGVGYVEDAFWPEREEETLAIAEPAFMGQFVSREESERAIFRHFEDDKERVVISGLFDHTVQIVAIDGCAKQSHRVCNS